MNNQQQHSAINSVAGSNQRAPSQQIYQLQPTTNMSQLSHLQQQQQAPQQHQHPQQQQAHMMSGYSTQPQKPADLSSRQYSQNMSTLNGSAYQPITGHALHSGLNMENQMNMHQHTEAAGHQFNHQQQQHQYPPSLQQHQHQQQQQPYQSNTPTQHHHQQQQQQQMQNQKQQMSQHLMQQSQQQQQQQQYNPMHHPGNQVQPSLQQQQQQQQQQAPHQHSQQVKSVHHHQQQQHHQPQQRQPYVHVQRNPQHQPSQQHTQSQQPKYDNRVQQQQPQPMRILQNTNSLNQHRPSHRPVAKEPFVITPDTTASGISKENKNAVVGSEKSVVAAAGGDSNLAVAQKDDDESTKENKDEEQTNDNEITDNSGNASENNELANTKEKTPMTLITELARFNKIERKFTLLDEQGPAHKKTFFVKLVLGTEEYSSTGASIRKAQQTAAAIALKETKFKHPEKPAWRAKKDLALTKDGKLTPTVELNGLAMKRGESVSYKAIEPQQPPYYYPPGMDPRGMDPRAMYSPRYYHYMRASRDPRYARNYWPMRYHYPRMNRGFYILLRVGHREFIGDGPTRQAARHNAAVKALKVLRNLPEKENDEEPEPVVVEEIPDEADELKSRITSVYEIAFRRNLNVKFEVTRESGPPHMKTFITRCVVGDLVTDGEANKKKAAKKIAAEQMYEKLKELGPLPVSAAKPKMQVYKSKKQKSIKTEIQQQKADPNYGVGMNPISRLIQIMCAQKKKEPVYSLVNERGVYCRKEFIMQVDVEGKICTGSGPTKKLAKRAAAEAMLELLGYNRPSPQPAKSSLRQPSIEGNGDKKVTFNENILKGVNDTKSAGSGLQQKVPGLLHLPSKTVVSAPTTSSSTTASPSTKEQPPLVNLSSILKPNWRPELQLRELCKALNYPLEVNDFTKTHPTTNSLEYMSRIHIGTSDNQQNFLGSSNSMESARDVACMEALKVLVTRIKDMHPAGDGSSSHMKKSVLARPNSGMRGDMAQQ